MGYTPSGRGPLPPDLGGRLKSLERYVQHVDRKFSDLKIPKATVAGAPLGVASVAVTTASIIAANQGDGTVDEGLFAFGTPYDPNAGRGAYSAAMAPSEIITGFDGFGGLLVPEGWYWVSVLVDLGWSNPANAPDVWYGLIGGGAGTNANYDEAFNTVTVTGRRGFSHVFRTGEPVWIADGDSVDVGLNYPACGGPVDRGLMGTDPRIEFTVTKWT